MTELVNKKIEVDSFPEMPWIERGLVQRKGNLKIILQENKVDKIFL